MRGYDLKHNEFQTNDFGYDGHVAAIKPAREPPALLCACITPGTTPGAPTRSSDLKQWSDLNPDRADPETAAWQKLESVATAA